MRDPDRYLPDPGYDDSPTDEELRNAADSVDVAKWVLDLFSHAVTTSDFAQWAQDRYREILNTVEKNR